MRKAVILCAGKGTRLGVLTREVPKVMLPIGGVPLLELHFRWLRRHGIEQVFINLHYLPDVITGFSGDGSRFGLEIAYSYEPTLRGTAGALDGFRQQLDETFLVHYGDIYSELDLGPMLRFHREKGASATLAVHPTRRPHDSDVVVMDKDCRVSAVYRKPGTDRYGLMGNAACYILEPAALAYIPGGGQEADFIQDHFPPMIAGGKALYAYEFSDFVQDMGPLDSYQNVQQRLQKT